MSRFSLCAVTLFTIISCQSPRFEHSSINILTNNSYIYYANISDGGGALKCVTDSENCCNDSNVGSWTDGRGRAVHQGADETTCLYVTRGHGEISLNRNSSCIPDTSGLWRCDVPDSSEVMQSIYIYISNDTTSGVLTLSSVHFTLHTEPSVSPPEFTITCHTQGGPATTVTWKNENNSHLADNRDNETSQVIVDTSQNSVYENRLRVRGRESGLGYFCIIDNSLVQNVLGSVILTVAGEPTNLTAVISQSNSTHIIVSWESPGDPVTGYVIYYQCERGAVSSDMVSGRDSHLLDGLQRGVTYNISIVALSQHLPSLLVGPVTVTSEASNETTANTPTSETDTTAPNSETTDTTAPSSETTDTTAPSSETTDTTAPSSETTDTTAPSSETTDTTPPSSETTDTTPPSSETTDTTAPSSETTDTTAPSSETTDTTAPSSETTDTKITTTNTSSNSETTDTSNSSGETTTTATHNNKDRSDMKLIPVITAVVIITGLLLLSIIFVVIFYRTKCKKKSTAESVLNPSSGDIKLMEITRKVAEDLDGNDNLIKEPRAHTGNLRTVQGKRVIQVTEWPHYVQRMQSEGQDKKSLLANEYEELTNPSPSACKVASLPHNARKNKFRNIYPCDSSRVCLQQVPGKIGSDYINASFITGHDGKQKPYVAAQGPTKETIEDFWRMVWEYEVHTIVMLTRCVEMGKKKCLQYWPESVHDSISWDMFTVTLSSSLPFAEYMIRKLKIKHLLACKKPLTVTQFHYTAWPDHGVPDNVMSIISFIRHVRKLFPVSLDQPLLVHCSAGVGRTGTFITLDTMMQQMKAEDTLSVYQCVRNLRTQRMNMVQTLDQYEFIHHALSELVVCGETEVSASCLRSFTGKLKAVDNAGITGLQKHFQVLEQLDNQYQATYTTGVQNSSKNRYPNALPKEMYRVKLRHNREAGSDYINASYINGYKQRGAYIATQGPLENTVEDFWRMVWEYQCGCIVMLCQLVEDGQESSYCYWPGKEGKEMVCGKLRVRLRLVGSHGDTVTRKMEVTSMDHDSKSANSLTVTMLQLISWPQQGLPYPTSIISLVDLLTQALMRSQYKKAIVMCSDGVVRSGTFICIHSQLERLKTEGVVDVFQAIKSARIQRPGLIPNTDHYIFCYEVLANYVENMDIYANFKAVAHV